MKKFLRIHCLRSSSLVTRSRCYYSTKKKVPKEPMGEYLYGPHAVHSALINKKRARYHHLYAIKNSEKHLIDCNRNQSDDRKRSEILNHCVSMDVPITFLSKYRLSDIIALNRHNGFILDCDHLECPQIEDHPLCPEINGNGQIWLAMEQPRTQSNVGSILRGCLYFGIDGVLYSTLKSCPLSGIVARTSSGALDYCDIRLCSQQSMNRYLSDIKQQYAGNDNVDVQILGLDMFAEDVYHRENKRIDIMDVQNEVDMRQCLVILVVGNEGFGLSEETRKQCDYLTFIQRSKVTSDHVDSISANVAVSIALHQIHYQMKGLEVAK